MHFAQQQQTAFYIAPDTKVYFNLRRECKFYAAEFVVLFTVKYVESAMRKAVSMEVNFSPPSDSP